MHVKRHYKKSSALKRITPTTCGIYGVRHIGGAAQIVEVGTDGSVFTVNSRGALFQSRKRAMESMEVFHTCHTSKFDDKLVIHPKENTAKKITPTTCGISNLRYISGNGQMVEVGTDGNVFSLNTRGQVLQRLGISSRRPQGTTWRQIPLCLPVRHVSYDLRTLWAVTTSGTIMKCVH
ncbi:uncharacterized protein V6R79_020116 [Siganus canaliculatus]